MIRLPIFMSMMVLALVLVLHAQAVRAESDPTPEESAAPGKIVKKFPSGGAQTELKAVQPPNREAGAEGRLDPSAGSQMAIGVKIPLGKQPKGKPKRNPLDAAPGEAPEAAQGAPAKPATGQP
jgi:hypothetical protein